MSLIIKLHVLFAINAAYCTYDDCAISPSIIRMSTLLHNWETSTLTKAIFSACTFHTVQDNWSHQVLYTWYLSEKLDI